MTEDSIGARTVNRRLLSGGLVMLGLGGILWVAGSLVTTAVAVAAVRGRIQQWDEPPGAKARRRYTQARSAAIAGAHGWRQNGQRPGVSADVVAG
ncbi:MAG TPA: hypothetical protein VI357_25965 [Mycobacteriales bacterium]